MPVGPSGTEADRRRWGGLRRAAHVDTPPGLSVDDAAYLALALELEGDVATRDHALARAAGAEGLVVID